MAGYTGFPRPELAEIRARIYADITNKLPGQDASIAYSPLNALAEALVGATYELYGYLDWVARQTNVLDCEDENLDKYGEIWSIARKSAAYATGSVTFTGTNGSVIPEGSVIISSANTQYRTTAEYTIASGTATANVKSVLPGISQNLSAGTVLTTNTAISGVDAAVTAVLISGGTDAEDAFFRVRPDVPAAVMDEVELGRGVRVTAGDDGFPTHVVTSSRGFIARISSAHRRRVSGSAWA
jgi:uncharacterized phage protein gp47/JayE